jgi:hypothetical protein
MTDEMYENILGLLIEQNQILRELLEINTKPTRPTNGMYNLWDKEQEEFLVEKYSGGLDLESITNLIREKFDIDRSTGALLARLKKLNVEIRVDPPVAASIFDRVYEEAPF